MICAIMNPFTEIYACMCRLICLGLNERALNIFHNFYIFFFSLEKLPKIFFSQIFFFFLEKIEFSLTEKRISIISCWIHSFKDLESRFYIVYFIDIRFKRCKIDYRLNRLYERDYSVLCDFELGGFLCTCLTWEGVKCLHQLQNRIASTVRLFINSTMFAPFVCIRSQTHHVLPTYQQKYFPALNVNFLFFA